jgi:hypothetical protein
LALYGFISGIVSFAGSFILKWFEGDWGPEYYAESAESRFFSDFYWMLDLLKYIGIGCIIFGIIMLIVGRKLEKKA